MTTPVGANCFEHGGNHCGYLGETLITDSSVIEDQVVIDARQMIQIFEANELEVQAMLDYIAIVKSAQENLETRIEVARPNIFNAWSEYQSIKAEVRNIEAMKEVLDRQLIELEGTINSHTSPGIETLKGLLIFPFNGPGLRCECYNTKKDKLSIIFSEISASQQRAIDLFNEANRMREIAHNGLRAIGFVIFLTFIGFVLKFVVLSFKRLLFPALAFLASLGMTIDAFRRAARASKDLLKERVKWTKLMIDYYQKQQIITCLPPLDEEEERPPQGEGEHLHRGGERNT